MWDSFASGLGKITNAVGDVAQSGSKAITQSIDDAPSLVIWGIIPCVIFYIILLVLIHLGFNYSLFDNCRINDDNEEKCYDPASYYSIYLLVPLVISIIISSMFYQLVFYIQNPSVAAWNMVS